MSRRAAAVQAPPVPRVKSQDFMRFEGECWLGKRLEANSALFIPAVFFGSTTADERKARVRTRILAIGPDQICGRRKGERVSYRKAFEDLYHEPLQEWPHG